MNSEPKRLAASPARPEAMSTNIMLFASMSVFKLMVLWLCATILSNAGFIKNAPSLLTSGAAAVAWKLAGHLAKTCVQNIFKALPDRHSTIEAIVAERDNVCVRASVQGTHEEEIQGIPVAPTGKLITWEIWEMFRFSGGKIVERWAIHNMIEQFSRAAEQG